jgi:hypothetical protein
MLCQRACAAAKIKHAQARAADEAGEQPGAVICAEDEVLST